jgi:hypothetical protein
VFTICDDCWDIQFPPREEGQDRRNLIMKPKTMKLDVTRYNPCITQDPEFGLDDAGFKEADEGILVMYTDYEALEKENRLSYLKGVRDIKIKNHKGSWEFVGENEVHYVCPELAWKINKLFKQSEILQNMINDIRQI